jgi:protein SCO1/2
MGDTRSADRAAGAPRRAAFGGAATALVALPALVASLLLAAPGCAPERDEPPAPSGALYDPPRPAPALRLTGGDGAPYDLAAERGRVVLVFFGFTNCPDVCPETLERWAVVRRALGADAARTRFLFVSVDPARDSPRGASAYAAQFDDSFVGVSGTAAQVGETALAWGVATERKGAGEGYDLLHSTQVFVVDPAGRLRWGYGRAATVPEIAAEVRALLAEGP